MLDIFWQPYGWLLLLLLLYSSASWPWRHCWPVACSPCRSTGAAQGALSLVPGVRPPPALCLHQPNQESLP